MGAEESLPADPFINSANAGRKVSMEMQQTEAQESVFKHNKGALLDKLKAHGITRAVVQYSGGGDEGRIDDVCAYAGESLVELPNEKINVQVIIHDYSQEHSEWKSHVESTDMAIDEVLETLCDDALELSGHQQYHEGIGGGGEMSVSVESGVIALEHYDIVEERQIQNHEF